VAGDLLDEPNEAFSFLLSNPQNAVIGRSTARATIEDDDDPPTVNIGDVTVVEGASGTRSAVFTLTLSAPAGQRTRVRYTTVDGSATAGSDYVAKSGEVVFEPGLTTRTVPIVINGDTVAEPTETFFVDLNTPTLLTIGVSRGTGTIASDDQ